MTQPADPRPSPSRIVVMTAGGLNPQVMINALAERFSDLHVIEERGESKEEVLKRRARRLGWPMALGQLATMIASRLGKKLARRREADILASYGLSGIANPATPVTRVSSLNAPETAAVIARLQPAVVFTISCRILTRQTLAAIPCPVINFHAGINPRYRGQMGGYWARIERDEENFGATVHLVDAGVDTGGTLYEVRTTPARQDTISTYPLLLTAAGTGAAIKAIEDALAGNLRVQEVGGLSVLRFPPPLWTYLYHGLFRRIW